MNKRAGGLCPAGLVALTLLALAVPSSSRGAEDGAVAASLPGKSTRDRQFDLYLRPPASATASAVDAPLPPPDEKGRVAVSFDRLAGFDYTPPKSATAVHPSLRQEGIPEAVRQLDGKRVRVQGFMLPLANDQAGKVTLFLIMRSTMACCYGADPRPNEWIVADASRAPQRIQMDTPAEFAGTLRVGAKFEQGAFAGIYALEVE